MNHAATHDLLCLGRNVLLTSSQPIQNDAALNKLVNCFNDKFELATLLYFVSMLSNMFLVRKLIIAVMQPCITHQRTTLSGEHLANLVFLIKNFDKYY